MNHLKKFREAVGLTQTELGARINVGQGAIGHYEQSRRDPSLDDCRSLVAALAEAGAINEAGDPVTLDDVFPPEHQAQTGTPAAPNPNSEVAA